MKFVAGVEYCGRNFHGWQIQEKTRTVQEEVEHALAKIANHKIRVFCAGRTDSGVHAIEQCIHFCSNTKRDNQQWVFGANRYLAKDVNLLWIKTTTDSFHARFNAIAREYKYIIYNHNVRSSLREKRSLWIKKNLDVQSMQLAANYLIGTHDFTSFRGSGCQAKSSIKTIIFINIVKIDKEIIINIKANAFLYHMVRNIVGTLINIGLGANDINHMQKVLQTKNREKAGINVKAHGLYFVKAFYDKI